MRKVLVTFLIILIVLMSASFVYARTATVNTRNLNFRDGATTYGTTIIKKLQVGEKVTIIEDLGEWCKVSYDGKEGYVKKEYIDFDPETETPVVTEPEPETIKEGYGLLTTKSDIYALPLLNSSKLASINENATVEIVSEVGNWKYILTDDVAGWILSKNIKTSNDESTATELSANTTPETNTVNQVQTNTVEEPKTTNETKYPLTMYVNVDAVNIRESASTDSDILTSAEQNAEVKVLSESGEWYEVEIDGTKGYVKKEFLTKK